jgi:hypothetical protein
VRLRVNHDYGKRGLTLAVLIGRHVQTDMGDQGARLMGRKEAPTTLQESVNGICARVLPPSPQLMRGAETDACAADR